MDEDKKTILKWFAPLAALILFLLPVLNTTLQYELSGLNIPIHWLLFLSAMIGGGLATIAEYLRDVYKKNKALLEEKVANLENRMLNLSLERDIVERDIMINSYLLARDWDAKNAEIKTLKDLERALKPEIEPVVTTVTDPDTGQEFKITDEPK